MRRVLTRCITCLRTIARCHNFPSSFELLEHAHTTTFEPSSHLIRVAHNCDQLKVLAARSCLHRSFTRQCLPNFLDMSIEQKPNAIEMESKSTVKAGTSKHDTSRLATQRVRQDFCHKSIPCLVCADPFQPAEIERGS